MAENYLYYITRLTGLLLLLSSCCQHTSAESDVVVNFDLTQISNTNGEEITEKRLTLPASSSVDVALLSVPPLGGYALVQMHSFPQDVIVTPPNSSFGLHDHDFGFIHYSLQPAAYKITNPSSIAAELLLSVSTYSKNHPVPGGCAMEFPTKMAPYLIVESGNTTVKVKGQKAAQSLNDVLCSGNSLEYEFFYKFSQVHISADDHFDEIRSMMTYANLSSSSRQAHYMAGPPNQRLFAKYSTYRVYYGMVVKSPFSLAVYSPASAQIVDDADEWVSQSIEMKLVKGWIFIVGLILCFGGHSAFPTSIFFSGFFAGHTLTYGVCAVSGANPEEYWHWAFLGAMVVGGVVLAIWLLCMCPGIIIIVPYVSAGYLLHAYIFYLTAGNTQMFTSDLWFFGLFLPSIAFCVGIFLMFPLLGIIGSFAAIGGYLIMYAVDFYFGTNLKYVTINPMRRLTDDGFNEAIATPPIETADIFMMLGWVMLTIVGFKKQYERSKGKAPFPPPPRLSNFFVADGTQPRRPASEERRPLLSATEGDSPSPNV